MYSSSSKQCPDHSRLESLIRNTAMLTAAVKACDYNGTLAVNYFSLVKDLAMFKIECGTLFLALGAAEEALKEAADSLNGTPAMNYQTFTNVKPSSTWD